MPGIFSALNSSAGTLNALESALNVIQNNVSNASTPGFAAQASTFTALPFDTIDGASGGVQFAGAQSLRDEYSERFVQQQNASLGFAQSAAGTLSGIEPSFDISGNSGLDAAFTQFFDSFSALSQDSNSTVARQQVLSSAQDVANAFQSVAAATAQASAATDEQIDSTLSQINDLAARIQQLNQQTLASPYPDPNRDATLHADLETLSGLVNFTSAYAQDGTTTVLIGGQTPLVLGSRSYPIQASLAPTLANAAQPLGTPSTVIRSADGIDISSQISGGQLGGLLDVRNRILPSIQGDATQVGSLNELAQTFADRVNSLLIGGQVSPGPPPVGGSPLFQYGPANATAVAQTLTVTSITTQQIASIDPGPPYAANGIALQIANLASSTSPADLVGGLSFTGFYGSIAATVGRELANAKTTEEQQTSAVAQAQSLRSQVSGVSLDQEAVNLTAFQRSYQATSKLVSVLADLTQTTIDLIR